jgi:hypothetical protein
MTDNNYHFDSYTRRLEKENQGLKADLKQSELAYMELQLERDTLAARILKLKGE